MGNSYSIASYLKRDAVFEQYLSSVPENLRKDILSILERPILTWLKNSKLRKVSWEVKISPQTLINTQIALWKTMDFLSYFPLVWARPLGLALPQLWIQKRIIIVNLKSELIKKISWSFVDKGEFCDICMMNPKLLEIINPEDVKENREACLSLPWVAGIVPRPQSIRISFLDIRWEENEIELYEINAVVFQHEFDHLNGVLYADRASKLFLVDSDTKQEYPITYKELEDLIL